MAERIWSQGQEGNLTDKPRVYAESFLNRFYWMRGFLIGFIGYYAEFGALLRGDYGRRGGFAVLALE